MENINMSTVITIGMGSDFEPLQGWTGQGSDRTKDMFICYINVQKLHMWTRFNRGLYALPC